MGFSLHLCRHSFGGNLIVADLQYRYFLHSRRNLARRGRDSYGGLGVQQQMVLARRHALGGADRQYEIPRALPLLTIVFLAGTMSMQGIIKAQGWGHGLVSVP